MAALFTKNHNYFILALGVFFFLLIVISLLKILRTKANKNSSSIKKSKEISFIPNFVSANANFGFIKSDKKDNSKIDANTLAAISAAISYYKRVRKRG